MALGEPAIFFYLERASAVLDHDYRTAPNEDRLAVFARTLTDMEQAIRKALRQNTITEEFKEQDLRPELDYIIAAVDEFWSKRSVKINGGDQTLKKISTLLYRAVIQLNSAATLENDGNLQHDKRYWNDYYTCYLDCAEFLQAAYIQIG